MSISQKDPPNKVSRTWPQWVLFVLMISILLLSILAFMSPISQNACQTGRSQPAFALLMKQTSTSAVQVTPTPDAKLPPPTPDEIGFTNGIIFWSTLLILILLIGTLREIMRRKDQ